MIYHETETTKDAMKVLLPFLKLYKNYRFRIALGVLLAMTTLMASIFLLALSGWFLAATAVAGFAGLYTFNYMLPAAGVRGGAILRTASRYAERLVSHDTTFRILAKLRLVTFKKILPLSAKQLAKYRKAELLNRLVADIDTLDHLYLRIISPLISAVVIILCLTIGLAYFDLRIALILGGLMLLTLLSLPLVFYHLGKKTGENLTIFKADYREQTTQLLQGHAELALSGAQTRFRQRLDRTESEWLAHQAHQANLTGLSAAGLLLISGCVAVFVLWLAAGRFSVESQALAALFFFAALAAFEALAAVPNAFLHLSRVVTSAVRVNQLCEQSPDILFPAESAQVPLKTSISVTFDSVLLTYPNQVQPAVNHVSFQLKAGEHAAILGKTGCGKSTLLNLLTRTWDYSQGQILLDDRPVTQFDEASLRQLIAFVPQKTAIFNATLRHNLALAAPNADDETLANALRQVDLDYLLIDQGLNQWLGEGGRQLSGGELRRIGIARALLHQSPLIVMDEPTEGLDSETEQQILSLIRTHCQHKTLIMVTHRLTGLAYFDVIYVMDAGNIVATGTHEVLLSQQGYYTQLHHASL